MKVAQNCGNFEKCCLKLQNSDEIGLELCKLRQKLIEIAKIDRNLLEIAKILTKFENLDKFA